ncbi:OmpA family protein [Sulfurospirillum barnesii]|uniref:Outer membrane protein/peptidoglycan-associated (Lipo)protein n=1 Tax=Sulfurospirillum barnesii (strain ATCC 700032 / DSM 10660 / SES-3) TaxID=760154 RepID=I3XWJ6_SULBS|nr:OmpA family protein [Sulfurospirillum barnesii]AFL68320.1 outer membrane protein/peptidoglycan-associated (lipo)protein [Sulfurospirillum barnesii SES-3]
MRNLRSKSSDQTFWVSYADLMAGLLFVFILLIGAIIIKYVYAQSDLVAIQTDLDAQKQALMLSEEELLQKKRDVESVTHKLIASQEQNLELTTLQARLQAELSKLKSDVSTTEEALLAARALLAEKGKALEDKEVKLELSAKEVENLKRLLLEVENERDENKGALLLAQTELSNTSNTLKLKQGELALLSQKLLDTSLAHQRLVEDLNITKVRIKNLTGIRIKVVEELKSKLGQKINIDPNSGAIRLPSGILFDVGSYELKPEAKKQLKETLQPYLEVLLNDADIRDNIDHIMIEGHTDSDGSYMHNLDLSQKRAYAVMAFIYSWDENKNALLQRYISAIGRSYSDRIFKNGIEDKDASRRIEIKFSLSNKKAINEIETFLERKE